MRASLSSCSALLRSERATDSAGETGRLVVFGLPKFSGNALFQADPPHWCDASFKYVLLTCSGSLALPFAPQEKITDSVPSR